MTIESRPEINYDWQLEFKKQRKTRLTDSVDEYLQDDDTTADTFRFELLDSINGMIDYHQTYLDKAIAFKNIICGEQNVRTES